MTTDLKYFTYGNPGHRPIVFLHGGPGSNAWSFEKSSGRRLAERNYHVVAYDQRGSGRSPSGKAAEFTVSKFTEDLYELIKALGLQSPILVGFSWGGFLSLKYLERYQDPKDPCVAKGVVMVGTPIDFPEAFFSILTCLSRIYSPSEVEKILLPKDRSHISRGDPAWWRHYPLMKDVERLQERMFPEGLEAARKGLNLQNEADIGYLYNFLRIIWMKDVDWLRTKMFPDGLEPPKGFDFKKEDMECLWLLVSFFGLLFASPDILTENDEFRYIMTVLDSLPDRQWLFDFNTEVRGYFHDNEPHLVNNTHIELLEQVSSRVPVHAIYGKEDRLFSARQMDDIAKVLTQKQFSYVDKAGHYIFLEKNLEFLDVLTSHLDAFA